MRAATRHLYLLHGFVVDSALALPGLPLAAPGSPPEVVIEIGKTPAALEHPLERGGCYEAEPERFLIWLEGTARFLVADGREIRIEPEPGADPGELQRLLLSSPLAALLWQRGLMAFHASAVALDGAGLLFLGGPCAGKSLFAARLAEHGARFLSDDITAVRFDDGGRPWILPGDPGVKLWRDALAALGKDDALLPRVNAAVTKRVLRLPGPLATEPVELRVIHVLESDRLPGLTITETEGPKRLAALLNHAYRPGFIAGVAARKRFFSQIAQLERAVRVRSVSRPEDEFVDRELARAVVEELRR